MEPAGNFEFQAALLERQARLFAARERVRETTELARLIDEVDAALTRISRGEFGLCEHCHDPIEGDRLRADPLTRFCLDHLTREDQRALEDDLSMAHQIQSALLPKRPSRDSGWDIDYRYLPAGPVSGDYCDVLAPEGCGCLLVLTGDVTGKGVSASLLVSHLHSMFRSMAGGGVPLSQMMARANRLLCESTLPTHYATLVCAEASSAGDVELCNAGHCPPMLVSDAGVSQIDSSGLPLGMFCSAKYAGQALRIAPGDTIVFYTDGVTEAVNPLDEPYGPERLKATLQRCRRLPAVETVAACLEDWTGFRSGAPQKDDVTVMALRRAGA